MRLTRSSLLGVVLLAAQAGGAEEGVSLEAARQELRQLESTQTSKAGSLVPDRVKLDTPILHLDGTASPVGPVLTERKTEEEERARRLRQQKDANWLVNGVERLAREEAGASPAPAVDEAAGLGAPATKADPADPQYLLKIFNEQEKRSATKDASLKSRPTPAPDPFAPFLQDWLGSSPVRSQVMEQFRKSGETASVGPATARPTTDLPAPVTTNTTTGPLPFTPATPAKANPYLVDSSLAAPTTNNAIGGPFSMSTIERNSPGVAPAPTSAAPIVSPAPEARTPAKGPPPGPADDKKYFPQLNRF